MQIRPADTADIPLIQDIAHRTWPVAYGRILSSEQMRYMLDMMYGPDALRGQMESGHRFLIASLADVPVAFSGMEHGHGGGTTTRLHKLYVLPTTQGAGVGRSLLQRVEQAALAAGDHTVGLNVNKYNPALRFYQRMGYAVVREEVIDIGRGYVMDDFVLTKVIGP